MWPQLQPQSTLVGARFFWVVAPPQDCLYLVFELCEGLDLLETIRRSKNGRRFARLGGIREMYIIKSVKKLENFVQWTNI